MSIRKEEKMAEEKSRVNENEKTLAAEPPTAFLLFPFGLFLLPLIIPGTYPVEKNDC